MSNVKQVLKGGGIGGGIGLLIGVAIGLALLTWLEIPSSRVDAVKLIMILSIVAGTVLGGAAGSVFTRRASLPKSMNTQPGGNNK